MQIKLKTKSTRGESYPCCRCAEPIKAGEKYYGWAFRYGGKRRQHESHGRPRPSQLTQSKMGGAYASIETAEDAVAAAVDLGDLAAALTECAEGVRSVGEEYQEAFENMGEGLQQGQTGQDCEEKAQALEEFADSLESKAQEIEDAENDEDEDVNTWFENLRSEASDALGELNI